MKLISFVLFIHRINASLHEWIMAWNTHKLSSENYHTPLQLECIHRDKSAAAWKEDHLPEMNEDSGDDEEDEVVPQLEVDPIRCSLSATQRLVFENSIEKITLADDNEQLFPAMILEAIDLYQRLRE